MKKDELKLYLGDYKWREFKEDYYYARYLQKGIDEIMFFSKFDNPSQELKDCINYFKLDLDFVFNAIEKELKPFLDEHEAKRCCAERLLESFPKATEEMINQFELETFADVYVKDKVREDLLKVYLDIKNYSRKICVKFLEE